MAGKAMKIVTTRAFLPSPPWRGEALALPARGEVRFSRQVNHSASIRRTLLSGCFLDDQPGEHYRRGRDALISSGGQEDRIAALLPQAGVFALRHKLIIDVDFKVAALYHNP